MTIMRANTDQLREICETDAAVELCVLFGSEVSGKHGPNSDVDIAVLPRSPLSAKAKIALYEKLADACSAELDVCWLGPDTDPTLAREALCRGRLIYESRPGLFAESSSLAARRYMDSHWLFRLRKKQLDHKVKELTKHVP